jgi:hypothetical protein
VCRSEYEDEEDCSVDSLSSIPSIIFIVSFFVLGVGTCMYYTLGIAYLDDNVRKNKTPILLGNTHSITLFDCVQDERWEMLAAIQLTILYLLVSSLIHKLY